MNRSLAVALGALGALALVGAVGLYATVGGLPWILALIAGMWLLSGGAVARDPALGAAVAGLCGLLVSLYLGAQHLPSAAPSACSVSSVLDCDVVNRSAWSELFGVPIAYLGSAFYGGLVALGLLSRRQAERYRAAGPLVVAGGVVSVLYSVFLAWASSQLGAFCLFCISLYGINALVLGAGVLWARRDGQPVGAGLALAVKGGNDRSFSSLGGVGLAVLVVAMGWYSSQAGPKGGASTAGAGGAGSAGPVLSELFEAPGGPISLDGTEPVMGDPNAPYLLVEWADFQCPYCAMVAPELHDLVAREPALQVRFKHYPISDICNRFVTGTRHADSCRAAAAMECARHQGRAFELNRLMFKNNTNLDDAGVRFMAGQVGVDPAVFDQCLADPRTMDAVREDVEAAGVAGVEGTPALFLRGLRGDEWVRVVGGAAEVAALVAAHKAGKPIPPTPAAAPHDGHGH
jgi:protein-disulfide isomerase/uncharacterized membrane protein